VLTTADPDTAQGNEYARKCAYDTFGCDGVNHYDEECPFTKYSKRLENLVQDFPLARSHHNLLKDIGKEKRLEICYRKDGQVYPGKPFRYPFQLEEGYGLG
jgi:hypothetical protein